MQRKDALQKRLQEKLQNKRIKLNGWKLLENQSEIIQKECKRKKIFPNFEDFRHSLREKFYFYPIKDFWTCIGSAKKLLVEK